MGRVGEPEASYVGRSMKRTSTKRSRSKNYDAKRYTGMLPGLAERMKDYMKHVRDDR